MVPTPSEGFLVLESTSPTKREIIYYTSKTSNSVVCPAGGRGYDGTTASSHLQNASVIMAPVAAMFESMRDLFETTPQGWTPVTQSVSSVAYNGNRSYTLTMSADVSATLSPGMRVRTTRTVSAPTQCTSLNGTTQYYNRTSASLTGMTFTDDFTVSAWIKLTSYGASNTAIVSRWSGATGWYFTITNAGQVQLAGFNTLAANNRYLQTYQSIPLNKWVHVTGSLDMSGWTTTTNKIMIDGVDVPIQLVSNGTNPTSLVQGGNLEIGTYNGGNFFPGKIAQVAIFNGNVSTITQATMRGYISQGLAGTETNLISAYSFNNSINDLNTTNANNLTAQGSAVATNADSPFSINSFGTATGTTDYGIIQSVATTTVVVQVPEGCTIPTSGGVSAMSYSTQQAPYGFTLDKDKWEIGTFIKVRQSAAGGAANAFQNLNQSLSLPIGSWNLGYAADATVTHAGASFLSFYLTLSTANNTSNPIFTVASPTINSSIQQMTGNLTKYRNVKVDAQTIYYLNIAPNTASSTVYIGDASAPNGTSYITALPLGV